MYQYWVAFRIEKDSTYQERYDSLIKEIKSNNNTHWDEPTSFIIVETNEIIDSFIKRITKKLNEQTDLVLVRYLSTKTSRVYGLVENEETLTHFMPEVRKIQLTRIVNETKYKSLKKETP